MEKLKIAVVGVGNISCCHIDAYRKNDKVELYAFCDINPERLEYMGKRYGVTRLYTDEQKMLDELPEINAVSVCTWNNGHAPCSIAALRAGKHVLCEKPMAMNAAQAEEMLEEAKKAGKGLAIGFVRRQGRDAAITKDFIESGRLGDIYYSKASYLRRNGNPGGWFGDRSRSGGGPLIDLGVHVIDLVRYLKGNPKPVSVYGATFTKLYDRSNIKTGKAYNATSGGKAACDVEDLASAMIRFEDGSVMQVEASFSLNTGASATGVSLFGSRGGVVIGDDVKLYTEMDDYLVDVKIDGETGFDFVPSFEREINAFVDSILSGDTDYSIAEDGVAIMKILDAVYESARTGHEVIIK